MIILSIDETHHIEDGKPMYKTRYKRVMSFHNGIAPIEDKEEAFFINKNNEKLYNRSFIKAYGFYEDKSAVKDKNGWFHIDINGNDIYKIRYAWVGNFGEERCVVRDFNNNYFHIDVFGKRVYSQSYTYTGDFKYGIAVVINKDGKATHIDSNGNLLHKKYFDELNIFHKGYAIAKDNNGYFHINKNGDELYSQRYMKIEDFYNGCALATTFKNNKIVLNEADFASLQITKPIIDKNKILDESFSYFKYQILFAILKLDILEKIQQKREIKLPTLSKKIIFRWLYVEDIIDDNNQLTELGTIIENELKPLILYWQDLPFKSSALMIETLQNAEESFSKIYNKPYFDFLEDNIVESSLFTKMSEYYTIDYSLLIKFLNLTDETICDIGGGNGKLINYIQKKYPKTETIVADKFIDTIDEKHIKIDFFQSFKLKSNVFLLSRVLHDWSDEKASIILQNIANNMDNTTILYLFETIVPINMKLDKGITLSFHLLNFVGGYERTLKDFEILLKKANLKILEVFEDDKLISLIKVIKI